MSHKKTLIKVKVPMYSVIGRYDTREFVVNITDEPLLIRDEDDNVICEITVFEPFTTYAVNPAKEE